ncbi:MAG: TIGR03905 family TSCPD domain-containing protein [Bacteroidales bacterium]|nr:TIGR03905 family TSCPD domain-containing protein [Bacteroidales bacterium]
MKKYSYQTEGTCSQRIDFEVSENNILHNVVYTKGCNGNLQGVSKLVEGMKIEEVIEKLKDIRCGQKTTSCPHQLSVALQQVLNNELLPLK